MMSLSFLTSSLYFGDHRNLAIPTLRFAPLLGSSSFICILSWFFRWSNKGEMQI